MIKKITCSYYLLPIYRKIYNKKNFYKPNRNGVPKYWIMYGIADREYGIVAYSGTYEIKHYNFDFISLMQRFFNACKLRPNNPIK